MKYTSLFSQLLQFFPRTDFQRMVKHHKAEYKTKGFSCWQQFVSMLFCHLGRANSLNEITKDLASCEGTLRHLGISPPMKFTLVADNFGNFQQG